MFSLMPNNSSSTDPNLAPPLFFNPPRKCNLGKNNLLKKRSISDAQWWFYLFAKLYVGSLPIVLFFYGGVRKQMQYYNTVNKCVYRNKSNVESVNSICCHSQLCQKTRNLFTYFITC